MSVEIINNILKESSFEWDKFNRDLLLAKKTVVTDIDDCYLSLLLSLLPKHKILILADDQILARKIHDSIAKWQMKSVLLPCSWSQIDLDNLKILNRSCLEYQKSGGVIVSSIEEWEKDWSYVYHDRYVLEKNNEYGFVELSGALIKMGYHRVKKISDEGEFSILGDIWQIRTIGDNNLVYLSFDNKILTEIVSEKKGNKLEKIEINSKLAREEETNNAKESFMTKIGYDTVVFWGVDDVDSLVKRDVKKIIIKPIQKLDGCQILKWPVKQFSNMFVGVNGFINILNKNQYKKNIIISCNIKETKKWIYELQIDPKEVRIVEGEAGCGGVLSGDKIAFWSDRELYGEKRESKDIGKDRKVNFKKLSEYKIGDLVVHADHGIAVLKDFVNREILGVSKDYLMLLYDKGDLLYVPVDQLHKISKYIGSKLVKLSRLGGKIWVKKKKKARKQIEMIAKELLRLYAKRKLVYRSAYRYDGEFLENVNNSFEYELTMDQKIALEDIDGDMDRSFPMDRLLCGDVGFGKTEIALRAAARVVSNKKQVAFLTPTTILSEQHWATFTKRFAGKNIRIEVLNRLRDDQYQNKVLADVKDGKVDIVIGTHRLLQKDIQFADLGMLIIDEEQKFGVSAKEKLKKIRNNIDILSLSATPIPRTLNMSMGGVRDLSILEIAPCGRQSINTEVLPYANGIIKDAVDREISRNGQVFIVHNRVKTIVQYREELKQLLGDKVKIGIAHGQMPEKDLANVMSDFAVGNLDILLATTIVENGLDLPNVNTLVVENSSGLGLSQLYQLRGRVGRSSKKAFAYFLYRSEKLKTKAKQRLSALAEAKELGSGLKLAVADMEIRGVGNILGVEQHGNAYAVGLSMFLDMLEEMVARLRNEKVEMDVTEDNLMIDLPVDCSLPDYYINDKEKRLALEQKLSVQNSIEDIDKIAKQLQNSYGVLGEKANNLIMMNKIRILAQKLKIVSILINKKIIRQGKIDKMLELDFGRQININEVNYLMDSCSKWIFEENKAKIEIDEIGNNWFEWLYKILLKNN
jgi:transcription-repair coupling factor